MPKFKRLRQVRQVMEETNLSVAGQETLGDPGQRLTPRTEMLRLCGGTSVTASLGHQTQIRTNSITDVVLSQHYLNGVPSQHSV